MRVIYKFYLIVIILFYTACGFTQDSLNVTKTAQIDYWDSIEHTVISGQYAYCAAGRAGLRILDISETANPLEISFLDTPEEAKGVYYLNNYIYVASGQGGLRIVSVEDPYNPVETGYYDSPEWSANAYKAVVAGNFAYVADGGFGLTVLDVSDISNPVFMDSIAVYHFGIGAVDVAVNGQCAYLLWGLSGFGGIFSVIDISDPYNLQELDNVSVSGCMMDLEYSDGLVYVVSNPLGLTIFDVSDSTSIQAVGSFNQQGGDYGVTVSHEIAYLHTGYQGTWVLDISTHLNISPFL